MRRSRSRLAAANGLSFDQVAPRSSLPAHSHVSRNITPGTGTARLAGEHAELVAVGVGVEVAEQHGGKAAGPALADERADRRDLLLTDAAVIAAPAQVRAEHLDRAAGPVDLGQHDEALLALVVVRAGAFAGERAGPRGARSASGRAPRCPNGRRRVRGWPRRRAPCIRARPRARRPGCAGRPPTPPAARRCRRRPAAGSR